MNNKAEMSFVIETKKKQYEEYVSEQIGDAVVKSDICLQ